MIDRSPGGAQHLGTCIYNACSCNGIYTIHVINYQTFFLFNDICFISVGRQLEKL